MHGGCASTDGSALIVDVKVDLLCGVFQVS